MKKEVTSNTNEIGRSIRNFYQQLYANKLSNAVEMEDFLETDKLPILKQEEIDLSNRPINYEEIETVIKTLPKTKLQAQTVFLGNSTKHSKKK